MLQTESEVLAAFSTFFTYVINSFSCSKQWNDGEVSVIFVIRVQVISHIPSTGRDQSRREQEKQERSPNLNSVPLARVKTEPKHQVEAFRPDNREMRYLPFCMRIKCIFLMYRDLVNILLGRRAAI